MSHWITLVTAHGPMNGWVAEPDDKPAGGIVLVHEIFGVNADMRKIADRYAGRGYLTVVPALFDKVQREVELDDYATDDYRRGNELSSQLGVNNAAELVATAVDAIGHAGNMAIIGYGWGGPVACLVARNLSLPCVVYYSTQPPGQPHSAMSPPALAHYGILDPLYESDVLATGNGVESVQFLSYPTGHGFDREGDPLHYHAESAARAFQKTLHFLEQHLGVSGY
ncbi:dienelactone hydrolase family protein [Paraburkholderia xenovorans LB400]|uniref:Dienelactone hydrolase n=1 Tax=Paraburkholderia xenovorans (strain LB400) TaxID=266265 RepID=Q143R9_PARXL|nr:dienelactone hydrolase family protein [Paraburkholderia xenovorans]ABE29420.1 Putative dienelactone hydrolase [Paraburkholderia xenovorans LB400]AIP30412.1 dienelactone hydrolase family protein [Paraburkholderia xenovorans LB400]